MPGINEVSICQIRSWGFDLLELERPALELPRQTASSLPSTLRPVTTCTSSRTVGVSRDKMTGSCGERPSGTDFWLSAAPGHQLNSPHRNGAANSQSIPCCRPARCPLILGRRGVRLHARHRVGLTWHKQSNLVCDLVDTRTGDSNIPLISRMSPLDPLEASSKADIPDPSINILR